MSQGAIFYAVIDDHYVIKFVGEVRLTLCSSLDLHLESVLSSDACSHVLVDLTAAECLDSTTLGLIAKLALRAKAQALSQPLMVSTNDDITRTLLSMGFDRVFLLLDSLPESHCELQQIPLIQESMEETQQRIISAHKLLMSLNDANREAFQSLVCALEGN